MKEEFLHYLWKHQLQSVPCLTVQGEILEIVSPGIHNKDAGPDFFNAKIKIGETLWVGNAEIHTKSSDWYKHKHQEDEAYGNVILHIVAENDQVVKNKNGEEIPTLELKVQKEVYNQYLYLMQNKNWIPCETFVSKVDSFTFFQWKERLLVERLERKTKNIEFLFLANNSSWEETFYQALATNFGFKTNALPFEMLAKSIPLNYLGKHKDDLLLLEAMLFGQAGLLPESSNDNYTILLKKEYIHLSNKFGLTPIHKSLWKFMRLRPANFPTLRIAQFAQLIYQSNKLFSKIIETDKLSELKKMFEIQASPYWDTHYSFDKISPIKIKNFGEKAFENIVINTIVPTLFFWGKQKNNLQIKERTIEWLTQIKPEENSLIEKWRKMGVKSENAFDTQALIQLKNSYCKEKQCLNCKIGNQVIRYFV